MWHKIESLHLSYSAMPTFVPPTPPVLVPPQSPFGFAPQPEPEPKAPTDDKKEDPPEAEAHASEGASPAEPGVYLDSMQMHSS